jgi:hypothetical protein
MKTPNIEETPDGFKVSIPNLLYGDNSQLPTSQADIDEALARVAALVAEIAPVHLNSIPLKFTNVHLTIQTRCPGVTARQFFTCFRNFRHPRVYADAVDWKVRDTRSGIQLLGTNLKIGAYDKRFEKERIPGDVVRFEIKLRKQVLKELLGPSGDEFPAWLQFDRCYDAFCEIMVAFPSLRSLQHRCPLKGVKAFLAIIMADFDRRAATLSDGRDVLSHFEDFCERNFRTDSTQRAIRAAVAATELDNLEIDFSDIFRPEWPPRGLVSNLNDDSEQP